MADEAPVEKSNKKSLIIKIMIGIVVVVLLISGSVYLKKHFTSGLTAVKQVKKGDKTGNGAPAKPTTGSSAPSAKPVPAPTNSAPAPVKLLQKPVAKLAQTNEDKKEVESEE